MPVFDQCDFDLLPGWRWWCDGAYEPPILADIICEQPLMTGGECVELKFKTKAPRPWTHTHTYNVSVCCTETYILNKYDNSK